MEFQQIYPIHSRAARFMEQGVAVFYVILCIYRALSPQTRVRWRMEYYSTVIVCYGRVESNRTTLHQAASP